MMPERDFTDKDLENIGWNLVDRMLAMSQPRPIEQPDIGLRLRGLRPASLRGLSGSRPAARRGIPSAYGGPRIPGQPEMLNLSEKEANHGYRP